MTRGYVTIAENSGDIDYLRMAYALDLSLKATQKPGYNNLTVLVTPGTQVPEKYDAAFHIMELPWVDDAKDEDWKVHNKWKYLHCSPYDETVFLDADMLFLRDVSHWWDIMATQDIWFSTNPLTYRGTSFEGNYYREVFKKNNLPNIYTAFTYFKKTPLTYEIFHMVELITHNWEHFEYEFLSEMRPKRFSMDVAFALALKLTDHISDATNSYWDVPKFIHMKTRGQGWRPKHNLEKSLQEDWTKYVPIYFTPQLELKIGAYKILEPFHYHVKSFLTDEIIEHYERQAQGNLN